MPYVLWSQDIFTKGELSPLMYARATVNEYNNGLKKAQNVLTYSTGAAGKRFGTLYRSTVPNITSPTLVYFTTFQYLNICVFQLVITPTNIAVYLEGILMINVSISLPSQSIDTLSVTTLGNIFRLSGIAFKPYDLIPGNSNALTITGITSNQFTYTGGTGTPGTVYPVLFSTSGALPTTTPQIIAGVTYFAYANTTTSNSFYLTSQDAANQTNAIILTNIGTGTNTFTSLTTWSFNHSVFTNLPIYDFNGVVTSYDALTFTPSATTGAGVTITVSGSGYSLLNSSYIGGAFIGGGGTSRITAVASATSFTVSVQDPFDSTNAILGSLSLLAEPAWSDARGWPQVASSYQSRALFANTQSLPNGFFASVINDYPNFGDLTQDDDDAISWYPTSDNMNYIRFIVPYRSITVHTNTGIYSSPLSDIAAITPSNFTLQLQDSTPADVLQPQSIDNQILVLSGNDAHQMLWDGINNAYTSNVVSVINEQTINNPQDETPFLPLHRAGSRFVFIINLDGSMAIFQTLLAQGVSGFTPHILEQSYGNASFLQAGSSSDGRCWFFNQREIANAASPIAISGFTAHTPTVPSTLTATSSNFSTTQPTAIKFTTSGTLPATTPAIITTQYYWAVGVNANTFVVYNDMDDALSGINEVQFTSAGTSSNVVPWPLETIYTIEELSLTTFLDCAVKYSGTPTDTVTTGPLFNAQFVKMVGDGFGFESAAEDNINNQIVFNAHGSTVNVSNAFIGFPIETIMEPMPLNISGGGSAKETTLTKPIRIMFARFMFNNTIGGTINDVPIALEPFDMANIGEPPTPARGIFEMSIMRAWDDFNIPSFELVHNDPFDIQLLGVFYSVEI